MTLSEREPLKGRFFYTGDGYIRLISEKNGKSFSGRYRSGSTKYIDSAIRAICGVFDAPYDDKRSLISLRLLEYLDFLEDRLNPGALISITSGYRSPEYNTGLRNRGGLAAKASLHQYGMAADLKMAGVSANNLWHYVKKLDFGGAGYYHGETVHIDVGPSRSWDETSSGVGTGISEDNKLIGLVTDYDIYAPGMEMVLTFIRMTAFPIGVNADFFLIGDKAQENKETKLVFRPFFDTAQSPCPRFSDIARMSAIRWKLPEDIAPGWYRIAARFCDNPWKDMPEKIETPAFRIK